MENFERYIVGRRAVIEALSANAPLEKIFLAYGIEDAPIHRIRALADRAGVSCSAMDRRKFGSLEQQIGIERNDAQGVIALRALRAPMTLESMLDDCLATQRHPLLLILDGITDPHNLGAIARSAEAAGVFGLIVPENYSAPVTPAAVKASAGALEHLPIAKVTRVSNTIKQCREAGWTVVGTAIPATASYDELDYEGPTILVVGSEGEGLHPAVQAVCDHVVQIPLEGHVASLNASVATGIVLFEIVRKRRLRAAPTRR
jgi:23S rRNA (guanosine2251-2'-O)-methyltransferase